MKRKGINEITAESCKHLHNGNFTDYGTQHNYYLTSYTNSQASLLWDSSLQIQYMVCCPLLLLHSMPQQKQL